MVADQFINAGYPVHKVLKYCGLCRSTYYYNPAKSDKPRGRPVSRYTWKQDGTMVTNEQVIEDIKDSLSLEFVDYGYIKMTHHLRQEYQYIINSKKVYRLMRQAKLIQKKVYRKANDSRNWVKSLIPQTYNFFDFLEFDIKYIWVSGSKRNALVLTVIDVYSRWVVGQYTAWQISQYDVIRLFDKIFSIYPIPDRIYVRNDNGSQMEAYAVQSYFKNKNIIQEFTKPATPEQNAHIESYHSIVERTVCTRYEFEDLNELGMTMNRWIKFYNHKRIHSGIDYKSPLNYLISKSYRHDLDYLSDYQQSHQWNRKQIIL